MDYTFFGFQIAIKTTTGSHLRTELARLIDGSRSRETIVGEHAFWNQVSTLLRQFKNDFVFGDWALERGKSAHDEFKNWTSEIETSTALPSSLQVLPGETRPHVPRTNHILFTAAFLVERYSNSDLTLGDACDIQESNYFTRDTFWLFLGALKQLNFASVRSDAVYMVPGPDTEGFPLETLMSLEFEYLRQLR